MERVVEPELLDELPPDHPGAIRERRDLIRVNACMGNARIMARALQSIFARHLWFRLAELGAGDGEFLLRVARRARGNWRGMEATLVDQQQLLKPELRDQFAKIGWRVNATGSDVFLWLRQNSSANDAFLANLFLHHFTDNQLRELFSKAAAQTGAFIAVEPRRRRPAWFLCHWLWLIGCSRITQHDAAVSVRAGFAGRELSALWPDKENWELTEMPASLCSHLFIAQRKTK